MTKSGSFAVSGVQIYYAGQTDTGVQRDHNEDYLHLPQDECLLMVADGMGGHSSGDVASRLAVETIVGHFRATAQETASAWPFLVDSELRDQENRLVTSLQLANIEILQTARRERRPGGMGTTLVAALFCDEVVLFGHVGDSRIYRIRDGVIKQMTEDHSLLNDYIKMKRITPGEIAAFPHHNVIVRALGMKENIAVDLLRDEYQSEDLYLLCTDGLSGMVDDNTMLQIVVGEVDLGNACARLIAQANVNGGNDNITVALAYVEVD